MPNKEQPESKAFVLSQNKTMLSTSVQGPDHRHSGLQQKANKHMPLPTGDVQEHINNATQSSQVMGTESDQQKLEATIDLTGELPEMQHMASGRHEQNHVASSNRDRDVLAVYGVQPQSHQEQHLSPHTTNDSRNSKPNLQMQQPSGHSLQSHPAVRTGPTNLLEAPEMPGTPSKVTKTRKKPKGSRMLQNPVVNPQTNPLGSEPSPEDLLTILLFRARQDKKARDLAKAIQQAKEAELEDMAQAYTILRAQMQELSQREKAQQAELLKYHRILPSWKTKIRRLEDYMKGLTNDHNQLRDDAIILEREQQSLKIDRAEVTASVKEAQEIFGQVSANTTRILTNTKRQIQKLDQCIEEQNIRHEENMNRLEGEQARNIKLEQDISGILMNQQQMEGLLHTQHEVVTEKMNEIFSKPLTIESIPSDFQKHIWDMLDRVLGLLTEIKAMDKANPEYLLRIDETIADFAGQ